MVARALWLCGVLSLLALSVSCRSGGGTSTKVVDGRLTLPQDAITRLEQFAFTTKLDVEAADGDYHLTFDGRYQKPDRVQGTLHLDGRFEELLAFYNRPGDTEIVNIGTYAWWREPEGEWQAGIPLGYEQQDPLVAFRQYATPWFYLNAFLFEALSLPVRGEVAQVGSVRAIPVRLDKQGIIDVLSQGGDIEVYPDQTREPNVTPRVPSGIIGNVRQVVPADFTIDVWFEENALYPARLVFDYHITPEDYDTLAFGFEPPLHLRLQMDITDPGVDDGVEPPLPIIEPTPSPTIPLGATIPVLSEQDKGRIREIALSDPLLQEILAGRQYTVEAGGVWHSSNLQLLGGSVTVTFEQPQDIEADWPSFAREDASHALSTAHYRASGIERLDILVLLSEERIARIFPMGESIETTNYTPPANYTPGLPSGR